MYSTQMSLQGSGRGMDFEISNSHEGGSSASSSDEEPLCTQVVDYRAIDRLHARRGWLSQQGGGQKCRRGGLCPNGEGGNVWCAKGGARRALLGGASVRLMSNATPPPALAPSRRSRRFTSRVGATALPVEDITTCDPPPHHAGSNVSVSDILVVLLKCLNLH
jgi:hypothetical protein